MSPEQDLAASHAQEPTEDQAQLIEPPESTSAQPIVHAPVSTEEGLQPNETLAPIEAKVRSFVLSVRPE